MVRTNCIAPTPEIEVKNIQIGDDTWVESLFLWFPLFYKWAIIFDEEGTLFTFLTTQAQLFSYNQIKWFANLTQLWGKVNYLEFFQNASSIFFTEIKGYRVESPEVRKFRKELSDTKYLLVFDWVRWITENNKFRGPQMEKSFLAIFMYC
nr:DUF6508 domain-containing protein [Paenibacillus bouchesdurhonensis]